MIAKLFAVAVLFSVTAFILRSFGWRGTPIFCIVCALVLLGESFLSLSSLLSLIFGLSEELDIAAEIKAALKILGVGYLYGISADICRELGEGGIAKAAEVAGRVEIMLLILPFAEEIIRVGVDFIG